MTSSLQLPPRESLLQSAYRAQKTNRQTNGNFEEKYIELFKTTVPPVQVQPTRIELFSLIDPNIRTVVTSTTATASQ